MWHRVQTVSTTAPDTRALFLFRSPDAHLTQRSRGHEHTFVNSSPWFTVLTRAYKATRFVVLSSIPLSVIMPAPIPHPSALGRNPKRNDSRRPRRSQTTEPPAGHAPQSTVCLGK